VTECRLLVDPPAAGAWNMAVDEALWESCDRSGQCCWRFYQWEEPTLSLGYFQTYEDRGQHSASQSCPVVRRASGGGAIVHDAELTYSLAVPLTFSMAQRRETLYRTVHTTLIEALAEFGVAASLCGDRKSTEAASLPFLCFQRRSPGDVLVGPAKIAGSAQRRNRSAVLQHGSILLGRSDAAPELDGLREIAVVIPPQRLISAWLGRLERQLGWTWSETPLSLDERHRAAHLAAAKYAADAWTKRHRQ
jgi:lipoate-protein ligase A